jgi:hypothetical protein
MTFSLSGHSLDDYDTPAGQMVIFGRLSAGI